MMRFSRIALAAVVVGSVALSACGSAEKEKELQGKVDACMKESADKDSKIKELESQVATMKTEMDALKAATPTPVPSPTPKGAKATPKPTVAKTAAPATPTPAAPTPTPTPTVPKDIKLPGKLPG